MIKCKCIKKIYNNKNITHYTLQDTYNNIITLPSIEVKKQIMSGEMTVSNLQVSKDGKLISRSGHNDDIIEKYYEYCSNLGIKPVKIELIDDKYIVTQIPDSVSIVIPKFVDGFKVNHLRSADTSINIQNSIVKIENDKNGNTDDDIDTKLNAIGKIAINTFNKLDELEKMTINISDSVNTGYNSLDTKLDDISNYVASHKKEFRDLFEMIASSTGLGVWEEFGTKRSQRFPINFGDKNVEKIYSLKGGYKDAETFALKTKPNKNSIFRVNVDDTVSHELYKHLAAVNDIRSCMVQNYENIMTSERMNALTESNANLMSSIQSTSIALAASINPAFVIGAGVKGILSLGDTAIDTGLGGKNQLHGEFLTWKKRTDIYGSELGYTAIDRSKLTQDSSIDFDLYAADIRIFVIDTRAMGYRRAIRERNQVSKQSKDKPYYKYVRGTLARCPVDDERLFNFYCRFYINRVRKYNIEKTDEFFDNQYYYTEAGYQALRCYIDNFINAFFAAKKFIGYTDLYFLYDINKHLSSYDKEVYIEFLKVVKYGLMLQGINEQFSDKMIIKYLEYDTGLNGGLLKNWIETE